MREEINFPSVHSGVKLERYFEFVQPARNDLSTFLGVLQRDDEALERGFFVGAHFLEWK